MGDLAQLPLTPLPFAWYLVYPLPFTWYLVLGHGAWPLPLKPWFRGSERTAGAIARPWAHPTQTSLNHSKASWDVPKASLHLQAPSGIILELARTF